jgi:AcrR family transcriptional regulator
MVTNANRRNQSIEKMLNSTIELLQEGGYAAFRIADVALRSGVSHGLIFRYFPTKNDLVRAAFELSNERTIRMATKSGAHLAPHAADRKLLLQGLLWITMQRDQWIYELMLAARYDDDLREKVSDVYQTHLDETDRVIREFCERTGVLPVDEAGMAVQMVGWTFQGLIMNEQALRVEDPVARDRLVDWIEKIFNATYPLPAASVYPSA